MNPTAAKKLSVARANLRFRQRLIADLRGQVAGHVAERAEERAAFQLLRTQRDGLERENAKLTETMEKARHALHACVKGRWDEAHVENAYFTLNAAL